MRFPVSTYRWSPGFLSIVVKSPCHCCHSGNPEPQTCVWTVMRSKTRRVYGPTSHPDHSCRPASGCMGERAPDSRCGENDRGGAAGMMGDNQKALLRSLRQLMDSDDRARLALSRGYLWRSVQRRAGETDPKKWIHVRNRVLGTQIRGEAFWWQKTKGHACSRSRAFTSE